MFRRELRAAHSATEHFCCAVEGHCFILFTDHKPLTCSLHIASDRYIPRELTLILYSSVHDGPSSNPVMDALSRLQLYSVPSPVLDLSVMACQPLIRHRSIVVSYHWPRIYHSYRRLVLDESHLLSHPAVAASLGLVAARYV